MRPEILFPLFRPVTGLAGVGPRIARAITRLVGKDMDGGGGEAHIVDLLWRLPTGIIDRRYAPAVADAEPGRVATLSVTVNKHQKPANRRLPYKVVCSDESGKITLVFFHGHGDYLKKVLPEGEPRVVSGRVELFAKELQMTHPDHIGKLDEKEKLQSVEPVYPLTAGLSLKVLGRAVRAALECAPDLGREAGEWIDAAFIARQTWPGWRDALIAAHGPEDEADLFPTAQARRRLAYDELLANQLALGLVRLNMRRVRGRAVRGTGELAAKVRQALPFSLTGSQESAIEEIAGDQASDDRMLRLLQGDVGSGKTVVALLAMLGVVEAGGQAALMAPTEILARQHMATLLPLCEAAGVSCVILTGREKGKARGEIIEALKSGQAAVAVGTHALFQGDVEFSDLRLAVIDEQHRFGVHQRLNLASKGRAVDVLVMTATPIPRTLMLTAYGDMDVSRLTEKPAGRKPVVTRAMPMERLGEVTAAVGRALAGGARVYWVCPLVDQSEALDLTAAEERFDALKKTFGPITGLVHGRMKGKERDKAMAAFAAGDIRLLVATTVIEVGVDVAEASVMVIEHAERFGLAQLHQLRGRIGRGMDTSTCLLLYASPLGEAAAARLKIMRQTDDGFLIAEEDLRLRGAGELLGTRQSGLPEFRLADPAAHGELLAAAHGQAELILARDPDLTGPGGEAFRVLLYLFERDAAVRFLRSG